MLDTNLTIAVECSMGAASDISTHRPVGPSRSILGENGANRYGTPLIMHILQEHGLRGVPFVEVQASRILGKASLARARGDIAGRGHDVQLHVRSVFHFHDHIFRGCLSHAHVPPRIHLIEPSNRSRSARTADFDAAYLGTGCPINGCEPTNSPWSAHSVWEIPLTVFTTGIWPVPRVKPLDIGAVSFIQATRLLDHAERMRIGCVNMILHSLSLFKKVSAHPNLPVIRRFCRLRRSLASHRERFCVVTFAERRSCACIRRGSASPGGRYPAHHSPFAPRLESPLLRPGRPYACLAAGGKSPGTPGRSPPTDGSRSP